MNFYFGYLLYLNRNILDREGVFRDFKSYVLIFIFIYMHKSFRFHCFSFRNIRDFLFFDYLFFWLCYQAKILFFDRVFTLNRSDRYIFGPIKLSGYEIAGIACCLHVGILISHIFYLRIIFYLNLFKVRCLWLWLWIQSKSCKQTGFRFDFDWVFFHTLLHFKFRLFLVSWLYFFAFRFLKQIWTKRWKWNRPIFNRLFVRIAILVYLFGPRLSNRYLLLSLPVFEFFIYFLRIKLSWILLELVLVHNKQ